MIGIAAIALACVTVSILPARAEQARADDVAVAANAEDATRVTPALDRTLTAEEWVAANRRPAALPALDASFAVLQILDIWSTRRAISRGAIEANPVMKRVAGNPAAFWTVKVAATVGPMLVAERLWRRNRVAAITLMAASNGILAAVAAHSASVLKRQR